MLMCVLQGLGEKPCLPCKFCDSWPFKKAPGRERHDLLVLYSDPIFLGVSEKSEVILGHLFSSHIIVF